MRSQFTLGSCEFQQLIYNEEEGIAEGCCGRAGWFSENCLANSLMTTIQVALGDALTLERAFALLATFDFVGEQRILTHFLEYFTAFLLCGHFDASFERDSGCYTAIISVLCYRVNGEQRLHGQLMNRGRFGSTREPTVLNCSFSVNSRTRQRSVAL